MIYLLQFRPELKDYSGIKTPKLTGTLKISEYCGPTVNGHKKVNFHTCNFLWRTRWQILI
jgi:hypothetical protein